MTVAALREATASHVQHLQLALELSPDAVAWTDESGIVRWGNANLAAVVGLSRAQVAGRRLADLLPLALPDGRPAPEHPVLAILKGRPLPAPYYRWRHRDTVRYWELSGAWRMKPAKEEPIAVFWLHEVTRECLERREASRLAALNAIRREAVIGMDLQGIITHWNEPAQRIYGYRPAEILGRSAALLSGRPGRERLESALDASGRGEPFTFEDDHSRRDGSVIRVVVTTLGWRDENGDLGGLAVVVRDVTEQRRMEALVDAQVQQLARSNRELERFAAAASHDLLDPLRKVSCFSDFLSRRESGRFDEKSRTLLDHVRSSSDRMIRLIEDLLAYSRLGGEPPAFEEVDLGKVVAEVLEDLEVLLRRKQVVVQTSRLPAVPARPTQMRQLFQNLIGNAAKFSSDGGGARIEVFSRPGRSGFVEILVRDNGIGFDSKDAQRIFEPLVRLNARDRYEGNGIGLATCRAIVLQHGGQILAEGSKGRGATFIVALPEARTNS